MCSGDEQFYKTQKLFLKTVNKQSQIIRKIKETDKNITKPSHNVLSKPELSTLKGRNTCKLLAKHKSNNTHKSHTQPLW